MFLACMNPVSNYFIRNRKAEKVRFMKELNNIKIIGLDNGYGNLKTANGIFAANVDRKSVV